MKPNWNHYAHVVNKPKSFQSIVKTHMYYVYTLVGIYNKSTGKKGLASVILLAVTLILITLKNIIRSYDGDIGVTPELMYHPFQDEHNVTPRSSFLVPNIVHFLRFGQKKLKFVDAVCILAAYRNHQPDAIYFHSTHSNFSGIYWNFLLDVPGFKNIYQIKPVSLPDTIYRQLLSRRWHKYHGSDVTRIRILMQYGGIFLDNDSYVVHSLDKYRYYEMTIGAANDIYFGTQVLLAHPDARFLTLWLNSYRDNYIPTMWYWNAGQYPDLTILEDNPRVVHRVKNTLGVHIMSRQLYNKYYSKWRKHDAIHLMVNHRSYLNKKCYKQFREFNHTNIFRCNFTFCEMAREAIYGRYYKPQIS